MKTALITSFLFASCFYITLEADTKDPFAPTSTNQEEFAKRDVFSTKVIIEKEGKEVGSFMALGSLDPDGKSLYCTGSISLFDTGLWRINVQADLRSLQYSDITIKVEDLKILKKNSDGELMPVTIFSTQLQSNGTGKYSFGEVQEVTIRIEIAKAEQAGTGQPATRPELKPESSDKPQPEAGGRSR